MVVSRVYDLDSVTSNTTELLAGRWIGIQLIGVDSSFEMLAKFWKFKPLSDQLDIWIIVYL